VDNDPTDIETINQDANLLPNQGYGIDLDHDGDFDVVVVGTRNGARVDGTANVDNDRTEVEVIMEDPNLPPNQSYGIDLDGDGDHDIIVIGTQGGARVVGTGNVDNDPNDTEILVEDPNIFPNQSYGIDLDGDGDHDIIVTGTRT
jgi:hypothetical protein